MCTVCTIAQIFQPLIDKSTIKCAGTWDSLVPSTICPIPVFPETTQYHLNIISPISQYLNTITCKTVRSIGCVVMLQVASGSTSDIIICSSSLVFSIVFLLTLVPKWSVIVQRHAVWICVAIWFVFSTHLVVLARLPSSSGDEDGTAPSTTTVVSCLLMMLATVVNYTLLPWPRLVIAMVVAPLGNACHLLALFIPLGWASDVRQLNSVQVRFILITLNKSFVV